MTPEQATELLPILQAISDGKTVQHQPLHTVTPNVWTDMSEVNTLEPRYSRYRIKPKLIIKYRVALIHGYSDFIQVATDTSFEKIISGDICFVRWLTDWVEVYK